MKRYFLIIFLSISFLGYSLTELDLRGKVVDFETNEPIAFASVFFIDIDAGTMTNEEGEFLFSGSLPKNAKVKVSAIGYQSTIVILENPNSENLIIQLKESHLELNEVTVSTTTGILQRHSITNVENRSLNELNTILTSNVGDAIANIPSVYNYTTGPGISKPVIRGLGGMRVVAYLNGLRLENQQWGGDHGLGVTENGIANVEVIKGPSSLLYGADALGGVVYFTDEAYATQNSYEAFAESQFETNSLRTKNFAGIKLAKNRFRFNVYGSYNDNADYQLPNGNYVVNSRFRENNVKASIGYNKDNWVMNLRYNFMINTIGLPGHTHDSIATPESFQSSNQYRNEIIPKQITTNHFALLENTFYFNNSDLKIWLGATNNKITEHEEKVTVPGIEMNLQNSTYNVRYKLNIGREDNILLGAQGMFQNNLNTQRATEILIPNATLLDNGIYALYKGVYKGWEYQAGARFDNRTINNLNAFNGTNAFTKSFGGVNYSAGAVKTVNKYTFRTNISSGFRPPHLSELLSYGVHHGTLRFEIGDINLKSERATQADIATEFNSDHLKIIINPFYTFIQDYIYLEPQNNRTEGYPTFTYKQSATAQLYGGDVGFHYHPHFAHQLHFEHSFSYVQAQDEFGNPFPLIPQGRFNSTLRFEFKSDKKIKFENISVQHLYFLPQDKVVTYETTSPSYQLINIGANIKFEIKQPILIKIGVRNLLNESYIDHLSRLKNIGLEAPGRNIYVSLRVNLKSKNINN